MVEINDGVFEPNAARDSYVIHGASFVARAWFTPAGCFPSQWHVEIIDGMRVEWTSFAVYGDSAVVVPITQRLS